MHTTKSENEQGPNLNNRNCNSKVTSHPADPQLMPLMAQLSHLPSQLLGDPLRIEGPQSPFEKRFEIVSWKNKAAPRL